jgi:hypothetical protein
MGSYSRTVLDCHLDRDETLARYEQILEQAWQTGGETPDTQVTAARPVVLTAASGG